MTSRENYPGAKDRKKDWRRTGYAFRSKYPGTCPRCKEGWEVGDLICRLRVPRRKTLAADPELGMRARSWDKVRHFDFAHAHCTDPQAKRPEDCDCMSGSHVLNHNGRQKWQCVDCAEITWVEGKGAIQ